ncbi:class V chitinase-like [Corylus avellana]|uniref:class V chitinase-like n=1 Tax=Corylus avellana TaxID=13451 RepID=UPI00286B21DD|nr:class V chitinase-like [Corylus avellana]
MTSSTDVNAGYWYWNGELQPENIDFSLFTHLFAAFAGVNDTYQLSFPTNQLRTFAKTVKNNSDIKAILSISGDTDPSIFDTIASDSDYLKTFIHSSIDVAREFDYDGLSLHWQYPNTTDQMTNLATLLKELRAAVDKDADDRPGEAKLLLTAAVYYSPQYTLTSVTYPIQAISDSLDWINVMAYDLYTPLPDSSPYSTAPPANLHTPSGAEPIINVDAGVRAWIYAGVPANKLVLGLSFRGRSWLLKNADDHEISSEANGPATEVSDPIPYSQIQKFIDNGGAEVTDPSYVIQYCYDGTTWIGYDGKKSILYKVRYAKDKGLLGYFAWHVGDDDTALTLSNQASRAWNEEDVARV